MSSNLTKGTKLEDDAAGLVLRLALKTRFSEMGWGSTPPSSAMFVREWCRGNTTDFDSVVLGSIPSSRATQIKTLQVVRAFTMQVD